MGRAGSGKSSIRNIIFNNYVAKDTVRPGRPLDVEYFNIEFLTNLTLNLWDCAGQDLFMEDNLGSRREYIFSEADILIYVFNVESKDFNADLCTFDRCYKALVQISPSVKIFRLIHKMDLVQEDLREDFFSQRTQVIQNRNDSSLITCFSTSIWDETLYRAWSKIVYEAIPNAAFFEHQLHLLCKMIDCKELVIFERSTLLAIFHISHDFQNIIVDPHRFEKISNILKHFKLSCTKFNSQFSNLQLKTSVFSAYICIFTPNTYIMVIVNDPSIEAAKFFKILRFLNLLNKIIYLRKLNKFIFSLY